ncbi:unnamed protein product [Ectocarpus sp. 12 AP-2014]
MQKPRGRATFALLCYYLGAATTTRTLPTAVSGFHHPCAARRVRRRPAGQALSPPPQQQLSNQRRSPTPVGAAQQQARGWGSSLTAGGGSVGGSGSSRSDAAPRGGGSRRRSPGRLTAASSSVLQCAAGDDEDDNYGSADYSEYGYEPEFELQGGEPNADEETLASWRLEKLLANDRWQFGKYGTQNVGNWIGDWQEYVAEDLSAGSDPESDIGAMIGIIPGKKFVATTKITRRVIESAGDTKIFEHEQGQATGGEGQGAVGYEPEACPQPVVETLFSDSFRGGNGTQVVGNAYTSAENLAVAGGGADGPWIEVGLRVQDVRMRCVFEYGPGAGGSVDAEGGEGVPAPEAAAAATRSTSIRRVFVVREGLDRLPPEDADKEPELYGSAGKGLYDPPSLSRSPLYFSIYAEGGLTMRFPLQVEEGQGGVFSVDWTAGSRRYQADRVFDVLDGSLRRLEVTEIGTQDAEVFLPTEKF